MGTLPGQLSLRLQQYYAHPRNIFWRLMGAILGASPELPYAERLEQLKVRHVALWDVCAAARRPGSLDTDIADAVPNDFNHFFQQFTTIRRICFNGAKAQQLYAQMVVPALTTRSTEYVCLPSTSPANAATSYEIKEGAWSAALLR